MLHTGPGSGLLRHRQPTRVSSTTGPVTSLSVHLSGYLLRAQEDVAQQGCEPVTCLVVAGGVAANAAVRAGLQEVADHFGIPAVFPPTKFCTDNGIMVAWTGMERLRRGLYNAPPAPDAVEKHVDVLPRWPLGPVDPWPPNPRSLAEDR